MATNGTVSKVCSAVLVVLLAGAITTGLTVWAGQGVQDQRIGATEKELHGVREEVSRLRECLDARLRAIEERAARIETKLETKSGG